MFVILFSLGNNKVLFEDYVKQFDNENFYFDTESEAFMRYLSKVEKEICIEKTNNCIEVLSAKLERGEFMCKLDPKDLKNSVNCILNVNKKKKKIIYMKTKLKTMHTIVIFMTLLKCLL